MISIAASVFVGALLTGAAYWPADHGWTMFFAMVPLLFAARRSPKEAFLLGWLYGAAAWAVGMYWFADTIALFLKAPRPVGWIGFAVFCAYHGLMGGIFTGVVSAFSPGLARALGGNRRLASSLLFIAVVVTVDGFFPAVFPVRFANTLQFHLPLVQSADLFGTAGLALLIAAGNAAVYVFLSSRLEGRTEWRFLAAMLVVLGLNEAYGIARVNAYAPQSLRARPAHKNLVVGIVQGNIDVWAKRDPQSFRRNLAVHNRLSAEAIKRASALDLLIWPETSYGRTLELDSPGLGRLMMARVPYRVPRLLGALEKPAAGEPAGWRYNTAFLLDSRHRLTGKVRKRHRMPFGEFIPFGRVFPRLYRLSPRTLKILRAPPQEPILTPDGVSLGVLICYEDVNAEYARRFAAAGAEVLVNITNDAWFGEGMAPLQHLRMSALRSIENRRYLLRAVNTGVSAVVDPRGRIHSRLAGGERGVLLAGVVPLSDRTLYGVLGRWPYRAALLGLLLLGWISRRGGER